MNGANLLVPKELCHRVAAQRDDYLWLNSLYLPIKVVIAGFNLFWQWIAIIWWATLHDICDKYIGAF